MIKETCLFCGQVVPEKGERKKTNGDMIRAMFDEELAVTLMCPNEMGMAEIVCEHSDNCNCAKCLFDWLRKET